MYLSCSRYWGGEFWDTVCCEDGFSPVLRFLSGFVCCCYHLLWCVFRVRYLLWKAEAIFPKSVSCRSGSLPAECICRVPDIGEGSSGIPYAARMDFRQFSAPGLALDVCPGPAISG